MRSFYSREDLDARLRNDIERSARYGFEGTWIYGTVRAVAEYLEGRTARRFQDAVRDIEVAADAAFAAVRRYEELAEELKSPAFRDIPVNRAQLRTHLTKWYPTTMLDLVSPLGRKDSRSDERLFVYRMFVLNRRKTRSPKVEAIAELMGLEGFRHQYDLRTIERLCARFAEQTREFRRAGGTGD